MTSQRSISRRAFLTGGVSLAVVTPLLAACTGNSASTASPSPFSTKLGPATLRFSSYGNDKKMQIRSALAAKFTQAHPNIKMVFEGSPSDSYFAKLATQIAGGNAPDIINLDTGHMSQYAPKGVLAPLAPYIPSYIDANAFSKDLLQLGQINGKQYGMPVATTSFGWTWDTNIFDEIGVKAPNGETWTWDDLADLSNSIRDKSNGKYYGNADPSGDPYTFEMWVRSHGHQVYESSSKLGYNNELMGEWFSYWAKLRPCQQGYGHELQQHRGLGGLVCRAHQGHARADHAAEGEGGGQEPQLPSREQLLRPQLEVQGAGAGGGVHQLVRQQQDRGGHLAADQRSPRLDRGGQGGPCPD
jgi:multiple sugar transport system substrate-binding protein